MKAPDATALQAHIRNAHLPNPLVCAECGRQSLTPRALNRHLRRHRDPNKHRCVFCNQGFHRQDELGNHVVGQHNAALQQVVAFAVSHNHPAVVNQPAQEENVDPALYQAVN
ncbi:hypothetical protein C8A01DRAFT_34435 [Parachaetomium inaequale]|uniref:C2H2-type domain-containing protein n=1 Tax=Parachaetomium inaequale TaxID=2588326 RepID=A0AAN6STA2_9PEZI|nr:hypothetical protein C8A01DRAFT_34435 [Parachaetomium inaequale]